MGSNRAASEYDRVRVLWTDLNGIARGNVVPASNFERQREDGFGFAAGVAELTLEQGLLEDPSYGPESGDIVAVPDSEPPIPVAWREGVGLAFADLTRVDGTAFDLCSRSALGRVIDTLEATGYVPQVGIELEFSLLRPTDDGGYEPFNDRSSYAMDALDQAADLIEDWSEAMGAAGFEVTCVHQESQPGQYEVTFEHGDPVEVADGVAFFRHMLTSVSSQHGLKASMMPAPYTGADANGLHVHLSLWDDTLETNAFAAETTELEFPSGTRPAGGGISTVARHAIGGLLAHSNALTAVCAPTVNSYRRLRPGSWAPVSIAWGPDNRSTVLRVPPHLGPATRLEFRLPDTSCNPYLALAAVLAAGHDGIETQREPPAPTTGNASQEDHERLPRTLWAALDHLEDDDILARELGEPLVDSFVSIKRDEFDRYQGAVSEWERETYLDAF
ncbi:glutamine synthetase family protein [Natrinema versiforme]|uniref:Glutamine synthetase n=1 Tax=Natrinema versiforme JCM 10478 TaxID=1227496 RepID=L9Y4I2_9EURY|nr:glutamine synthetase family protein [Natrinema versiforme]ELY68970.1 glutamine synthetase [Natrinema versiforme JCM 10478]